MKITARQIGEVVILDLHGELTIGENADALREKVAELVKAGRVKIVLNFADVPYADITGVGEIIRSRVIAVNQGGALKLLTPSTRAQRCFEVTGFNSTPDKFYDTEIAAVGSFSRQKGGAT